MAHRNNPEWLKKAVFYQIYPQSYYDSNDDGIGDIPGIIQKLDYLESLGVTGLWLNPCFVSPFSDAGYDVADYRKVAPRYGTNDDLKQLFTEAGKRGIKVLLDLVPGHTSMEHPWFQAAARADWNEFSDYYIWNNSIWEVPQYDLPIVRGYGNRDGGYITNFFYTQPALNFGFTHPDKNLSWMQPVDASGPQKVRREIRDIMQFWLEMGASGFRVDMAASLVKRDPEKIETARFWTWIREWMDAEYPEAVIISEWGHPDQAIPAGFHMDFLLGFDNPGVVSLFRKRGNGAWRDPYGWPFFDEGGHGDIRQFVDMYINYLDKVGDQGYMAFLTGNHDENPRLANGKSTAMLKLIYLFMLTMPGTPFIYYGDEIGMQYRKLASKEGGYERTGVRTPMQWANTTNAGFSNAPAEKLYLPVSDAPDRPTVAEQEADPDSLLNRVRSLIRTRKALPALQADGGFKVVYAESGKLPFVYLREKAGQKLLVALNPSNREVSVDLPEGTLESTPEAIDAPERSSLVHAGDGWRLTLGPISGAMYKVN
ncbi:MAG: alpha-glucosidase C-terminal domain-containing protein [Anaerolineaceae bacterium]|nr:alpha-glucosidase C-terminal domain-containing protein [Anaerolineaceae bacterium]